MMSVLVNLVLPFVGVLTVLIFVHELGHYAAARLAGVAVERFSVGFGPGFALGRDRHGTEWRVGLLPLGGYVRMKTEGPATAAGRNFNDAGSGAKAFIAAAGPAANLLFAFLLTLGLFAAAAVERTPPLVAAVAPDSPAASAGLRPGDEVLSLNGRRVGSLDDITQHAALRLDEPLHLVIRRGADEHAVVVRPVIRDVEMTSGRRQQVGVVGAYGPEPESRRLGLGESARAAVRTTVGYAGDTLVGLRQVVSGQRSLDSLAGIIGIAQLVGEIIASAGWPTLVAFLALISVNVAVVNLLPLPVLDGGIIFAAAVERWRGRPMPALVSRCANVVGVGIILGVLALTTWNDISVLG